MIHTVNHLHLLQFVKDNFVDVSLAHVSLRLNVLQWKFESNMNWIMSITQTFLHQCLSGSDGLSAQRKLRADPQPWTSVPPAHDWSWSGYKVKEFTFFTSLYDTRAESPERCVCCGFMRASFGFSSFPDPRSLVHIKAATHLVLSRGRGQVDTRGLHFSSGGMSEGSEGLVAAQRRSPRCTEINQSAEEQSFPDECWKISLVINLRGSCLVLFYQVYINLGNNCVLYNGQLQFNNIIGVHLQC